MGCAPRRPRRSKRPPVVARPGHVARAVRWVAARWAGARRAEHRVARHRAEHRVARRRAEHRVVRRQVERREARRPAGHLAARAASRSHRLGPQRAAQAQPATERSAARQAHRTGAAVGAPALAPPAAGSARRCGACAARAATPALAPLATVTGCAMRRQSPRPPQEALRRRLRPRQLRQDLTPRPPGAAPTSSACVREELPLQRGAGAWCHPRWPSVFKGGSREARGRRLRRRVPGVWDRVRAGV